MYLGESSVAVGVELTGQSITLTKVTATTSNKSDDIPRNTTKDFTIKATIGNVTEDDRAFLGSEYAGFDMIRLTMKKTDVLNKDDVFTANEKNYRVIMIKYQIAHNTVFAKNE